MYFSRLMFYLLWSLDNLSRSSVCLNKNKTASYVTRIDDSRFNCWNSIDVHFPENHTKKGEEIYKTISFITITKYSAKPPTPSPKNRRWILSREKTGKKCCHLWEIYRKRLLSREVLVRGASPRVRKEDENACKGGVVSRCDFILARGKNERERSGRRRGKRRARRKKRERKQVANNKGEKAEEEWRVEWKVLSEIEAEKKSL